MKVFEEVQRFRQPWILILLTVSILVPIGLIIKEYTSEHTSMSTVGFLAILFTMLLPVLLIFSFTLKTRIDEKGIHYRFFPFHRTLRTILWQEILTASVRKYDAITEYGGWGLKGGFRRKKGVAVNVSGNIGIQLELANGKKLLIGTQKQYEAIRVLKTYEHKLQMNTV